MSPATRRARAALAVVALLTISGLTVSGCSVAGTTPPSPSLPGNPGTPSAPLTPALEVRARPSAASPPPAVPTVSTDPRKQSVDAAAPPVQLTVSGRDIDMPVVPVGVEENGDMALPPSNRDAGWYEFGGRPADEKGVTVLAAHVDTVAEGLGPFARLRDVRKGAEITVRTADGSRHRYRVSDVDEIAKRAVPLGEVFERTGPARLVLITCGGAYDQGVGYTDNVVVTAVPES